MEKLLTAQEAADMLRIHEITLRRWHSRGLGPPRTYIGGSCIRYVLKDIQDYIDNGKVCCCCRSTS